MMQEAIAIEKLQMAYNKMPLLTHFGLPFNLIYEYMYYHVLCWYKCSILIPNVLECPLSYMGNLALEPSIYGMDK